MEIEGRTVCVTGASRGLGESLARAFHARGARLILGARSADALEALADSLPGSRFRTCDVRRVSDLERLVEIAEEELGGLDVMINNAGVSVYGPFLETTEADFDEMLATNVKGTYFGSQLAFRAMKARRHGTIVNVSSIAGVRHLPNESAYSATKWAVQGLTGILHHEAAPYGVRVTSLVAGGIATPFWNDRAFVPFPTAQIDPAKDFMDPDEVASVVVDVVEKSDRFLMPEVVCLPMLR
jgi:3alpha(or 20beta)-hydroxysteroid dehydrogenase